MADAPGHHRAMSSERPLWRDAISREEIKDLLAMRDWRSWLSVVVNWGLVAASFAAVAWWPNPLVIVAAIVVIGARQLGFAVLMHEAAHRSLFSNRTVNDFVGNWLCAFPVWSDLRPYRPYHLQHHAKNWTDEDPDLALATPFPITTESMRRKIWRDVSGQTGWKRLKATVRRDLGLSRGRVKRNFDAGIEALHGVLLTNGVLLAILTLCGHPALYLLWVAAWMTSYSFVMRLRSIAEHAMIPDPADELNNTRTTIARLWERLLIAPNCVNFHLEHHLLPTVPHYNLRRMHRMLRERGVLDRACVTTGYAGVLRLAASRS
jgi:fatty acid desaturase